MLMNPVASNVIVQSVLACTGTLDEICERDLKKTDQ